MVFRRRAANRNRAFRGKAQIALDNGLAINFIDLETVEEDLPRLLEEKKQLDAARKAVRAEIDFRGRAVLGAKFQATCVVNLSLSV